MLSEDNISGLIGITTGMILFKTVSYFEQFESFLSKYKVYILIGVLLIYFNRKEIANKFKRVK